MCGLFGAVSNTWLSFGEKKILEDLAVMSQLRGTDSTGIVTVHKKKNKKLAFHVTKKVLDASEFIKHKDYKNAIHTDKTFLAAGHTRKATCGDINETNAHPIQEGKIIGLHNGTIPHFQPHKNNEGTRTDSRSLIEKINKNGIEDALSEIGNGAYALVFLDLEQRTLNFCRNQTRPLYYMFDKDKTILYWASEGGMLKWLRERESIGAYDLPQQFGLNTLYSIQLGSLTMKETEIEPLVTQTEIYPLRFPTTHNNPLISWCRVCHKEKQYCYCDMYPKSETQTNVPAPTSALSATWYRGWERRILRIAEVIDILKYGCSFCNIPLLVTSQVMWVTPHKVICQRCLDDKSLYTYARESFERLFPGAVVAGSHNARVH